MSPLFMDTSYESNSSGSLSPDECNSNAAGSEREGKGQHLGNMGTKRREKNRDAARKSRRKQTERADELHEELQCIERSNSALKKEIAALKRDFNLYKTALERHEPYCCLRACASSSSSPTCLSVSLSADCQAGSSPPGCPPQASDSSLATAPSPTTSLTSSLDLQTFDCVENSHLSSATSSSTTTLASSSGLSTELFNAPSSSPVTVPHPFSFSTLPAPHSLFSKEPLITSKLTNGTPVCTSLISNTISSSILTSTAQTQPLQDTIHEKSSASANTCASTSHFDTLDEYLMKQTPFMVPFYSHLVAENAGRVTQDCPMDVPQLHAGHYIRNPDDSSPPSSLLLPTFQGPAPESLLVSPLANLEPFSAPSFALKSSSTQQITPTPVSLLSLLNVPSPPSISQTICHGFDGLNTAPPPLLPMSDDPLRDLSLSELLEDNDWILNGTSNQ